MRSRDTRCPSSATGDDARSRGHPSRPAGHLSMKTAPDSFFPLPMPTETMPRMILISIAVILFSSISLADQAPEDSCDETVLPEQVRHILEEKLSSWRVLSLT